MVVIADSSKTKRLQPARKYKLRFARLNRSCVQVYPLSSLETKVDFLNIQKLSCCNVRNHAEKHRTLQCVSLSWSWPFEKSASGLLPGSFISPYVGNDLGAVCRLSLSLFLFFFCLIEAEAKKNPSKTNKGCYLVDDATQETFFLHV